MQSEIAALELNNTWSLVDLPLGKHAIVYKLKFKIKYHFNGNIERFKACLVAQDFTQQEGFNYIESFSLVAKLAIIQTLLVVASIKGWFLKQFNIQNAFLQDDLDE